MAYENFWPQSITNLSATGSNGQVTVTSTAGFYVRQLITVSQGANLTTGAVKEILSATSMRVGSVTGTYPGVSYDMSGYGAGAVVMAPFQTIVYGNQTNVLKDVYECEPTKALRVMTVDQLGRYIDPSGASTPISVTISGLSVTVSNSTLTITNLTTAATFQFIKVAAATLTASITSGNPFNAGTFSGNVRNFSCINSLNQTIGISLNGVQIAELENSESFSFDLASNGRQINASTTIGVWNFSVTSTSGECEIYTY